MSRDDSSFYKDLVLNNLHSTVQEVEWEAANRILKDSSEPGVITKTLVIPVMKNSEIIQVTLKVTIGYELE